MRAGAGDAMIRRRYLVTAGAGLALAGLIPLRGAAAQDKTVLTAFDTEPDSYPTVQAVAQMGKKLAAATKGRITIERYAGKQIVRETEAIGQLQAGALQVARLSVAALWPIIDDLNVLNLPFLFRNTAHMNATVDSEVGTTLLDRISQNAQAKMVGLCWMDAGARNIYDSKRPIRTVPDVKGLRIRVTTNPLILDMINYLGGEGVAMRYDGVLEALRSGAVDGAENNMPSFASDKHYEAAKYYNLTEHLIVPEVLVFSRPAWATLSTEDQGLIARLAQGLQRDERELWRAAEEAALKTLEGAGIEIVPIADKDQFRDAVKPVWDKYGDKYVDLIRAIDEIG
jgi:tripartite ATP-independent transporter DctP family solute receptor